MSPEQYQRVKGIFLAVCDRPAEEQGGATDELCAGDADLKAEVESLLQSHRRAAELMNAAPAEDAPPDEDEISPTQAPTEPQKEPDADLAARLEDGKEKEGSSRVGRSLRSLIGTQLRRGSDSSRTTLKGRFDPGTILADRYRIVSVLGLGGMGEVYRADDLTLDQAVALKFLPQSFESDPAWLDRLHNEVRMSRQVTHPNVCRIFDIGQVEGQQFITMEFVDGEDLASLLRRIGRLPRDKALQIARQMCAGLAAAHDRGVLHRDLKPANIMLDGRGQVRITDFGIAGTIDGGEESAAGTPAYMAPEQFSRGEATIRSDIYSLGLVLYEIFSGRAAFSAHSMPEYARLHKQTAPTHPSTYIDDMDPLVERVILRCLEKDPARRPASALAVSAALPGGDPLAAALAAGETPSPEMVAAAGDDGGMTVSRAGILLAVVLLALGTVVGLSSWALLVPTMVEPDVLKADAQSVLKTAGFPAGLRDEALGFSTNDGYIAWCQTDHTWGRWNDLIVDHPGVAQFFYRQSVQPLVSRDETGMVTADEPTHSQPGMRTVILDAAGQLRSMEIYPRADFPKLVAVTAADFPGLFNDAGLNIANYVAEKNPAVVPPMYADAVYAWNLRGPPVGQQVQRVEAATRDGACVYFKIIEPWMSEVPADIMTPSSIGRNVVLHFTMIVLVIGGALILAWRNLRGGRVDSSGGQRLGGAFLVLGLLVWAMSAKHVPDLQQEIRLFFRSTGFILLVGGVAWLSYLALEPYVRRIWPETIISWSRLLTGRIRDPLVASHVLVGLAAGAAASLLAEVVNRIPKLFHTAPQIPLSLNMMLRYVGGENPSVVAMRGLLEALAMGLIYLLMLVMVRLVVRRRRIATTVFVLLVIANTIEGIDAVWVAWVLAAIVAVMVLGLLVRFGLVATVAGLWTIYLLRYTPITWMPSLWYFKQTRFEVLLVAVVAVAAASVATLGWKKKLRTPTLSTLHFGPPPTVHHPRPKTPAGAVKGE